MTDWIDGLAARKLERRRAVALAEEKALSDRKLIEKAAPHLWCEIHSLIQAYLYELAEAMDGEQLVRMEYDSHRRRISLRSAANGRELYCVVNNLLVGEIASTDSRYVAAVRGVSEVVLVDKEYQDAISVETLAQLAVERAFRRV